MYVEGRASAVTLPSYVPPSETGCLTKTHVHTRHAHAHTHRCLSWGPDSRENCEQLLNGAYTRKIAI